MKYFAAFAFLMAAAASAATTTTTGTSKTGGDPIMSGFDGRSFEFFGKAGNVYNVLSERNHQVAMKLKEGKMWDHEGTYVQSLGFQYMDHTVEMANEGDDLVVILDGEKLAMRPQQKEQEVLLGLAQGELQLLWQLHRPEVGNAVEINTDVMQVVCYVTPAGTRDEGGVVQPAYLNFDITLIGTPAQNTMEGIVGRTFSTAVSATAEEDDFKFHGVEAEFEMASLFATAHAKSVFGKASATKGRKLIESATYPMRASSKGFSSALHASSQGLIKARKALN